MTLATHLACVKCGSIANQEQILDNRLLGRGTRCNNCVNAILKARRKQNSVSEKLYNMLSGAKRRANQKGLQFDLTLDDLRDLVTWRCPALGIQLDWSLKGSGNVSPCSPSLDRIDSRQGYIKSNVVIISRRANTIKSDANAKELLLIGKWLESTNSKKTKEGSSEKKYLTNLQKEQIKQFKQQGMTYRQIAKVVGCPKSTVGYFLQKNPGHQPGLLDLLTPPS